jgi:hypothetical protein
MTTSETRPVIHEAPGPWRHHTTWAVGGLFQVGYAENSDLLLVLSSQGRGIFNCLTGEKVARDYEEAHEYFDPIRLIAQGFGPLEGKSIRMAGLFGGGLPLTTEDEWGLEEEAPAWPTRSILLTPPPDEREDGSLISGEPVVIGDDFACELRAYGFSETGRSFVIAISCDLVIFTR